MANLQTLINTTEFTDTNTCEFEIEYFYENLQDLEGPWKIEGSLGLWDGRHQIVPEVWDGSLAGAIAKCAENMDNIIVKTDGEIYFVDGIHHDGTNQFVITKTN